MSHPVMHWEIAGRDVAALREFYAKVFGWTMKDAGPTYLLVEPGEGGVGGGLMKTPDGIPPYVTVYVRVDDIEATLADIAALGGTALMPPTVVSGTVSFAVFRDPEGNVVGLLQTAGPVTA